MKAFIQATYKLVGEMLATMVTQGGPLPQLFNNTTDYLMHCSIDVSCQINDLPEPDLSAVRQDTAPLK